MKKPKPKTIIDAPPASYPFTNNQKLCIQIYVRETLKCKASLQKAISVEDYEQAQDIKDHLDYLTAEFLLVCAVNDLPEELSKVVVDKYK